MSDEHLKIVRISSLLETRKGRTMGDRVDSRMVQVPSKRTRQPPPLISGAKYQGIQNESITITTAMLLVGVMLQATLIGNPFVDLAVKELVPPEWHLTIYVC